MKFIRLKLKDYRGIEDCDVSFDPSGITVIQGQNEAGKTSLAESINILFEFPDNSKSKAVKTINPVHRDAGPEIELEAESGPYHFTYTKRFHKKPATHLVVTEPVAENLTGREAHDRAEAILRETIDIDLWQALTVQQGDEIGQPDLTDNDSLSSALDRAAGGHPDDSISDDLYEKVHQEFLLYFTEGSADKNMLKEARHIEADVKVGIDNLEGQINELDRDIAKSVSLKSEISQLTEQEKEQSESLDKYSTALQKISELSHTLEKTELKLNAARMGEEKAGSASEERQELIKKVASDTESLDALKEAEGDSAAAAKSAEDDYRQKQVLFKETETQKKESETLARIRRDDHDFYISQINLDLLTERKDRVDKTRVEAVEATKLVASNLVDADALKKITAADRQLIEANARLMTGAPHLRLRGLGSCGLDIDGTRLELKKDEERDHTVADEMQITISDLVEIRVSAGSSLEELTSAADSAKADLDELCKKLGVTSPEAAKKAFDARAEAERKIENKKKVEEENLRDLTYEELKEKIAELAVRVSGYPKGRVKEPVIAPDEKSAKSAMAASEKEFVAANQNLEAVRSEMDSAREVRDRRNTVIEKSHTEIQLLTDDLEHNVQKLEKARSTASDESLVKALDNATTAVADEEKTVKAASEELQAENPEKIEALATAAEGSLKTTKERLDEARTDSTEVKTQLKIRGEEGIHERLEEERRRLDNILNENASLFRRADAAKLLFETMREEREESRRAYVAPLKQAIERLGKLVFDDTFQVEVDEDLQIAKRTLNGITVPFDSLSGGTREQLSLIFRLACCIIMAEDGGTPLILDDALGYSDVLRLKTMGAVLSRAARETQIIIFTCMPSRYSYVGEAKIVRLD